MNYACYRLPYADKYTRLESAQSPTLIRTIGEKAGFVAAPFAADKAVLIHPDSLEELPVTASSIPSLKISVEQSPSCEYQKTFARFHDKVTSGCVDKLVLARSWDVPKRRSPMEMFLTACQLYPRLMVMLFHTDITGTWLIASPEILLESTGGTAHHTVALAGTMPYSEGYGEWSEKNRQEQHIVEKYIATKLEKFCHDIVTDGPVTMRAGHLQHLRTDFHFKGSSIGEIISALHPTPAVCGFPVDKARQIISAEENLDRGLYSGFAGPVAIGGDTRLYVSIRCARLFEDHATLYAGGGIMPDSDCLSEWEETNHKMETILRCM